MAALWQDTYTSIYNLISDYIDFEGGNVTNLALDTINRSVQNLANRRVWDFLVKDATLTLSGTSANLPSDLGKIISVYTDSDNDGYPEWRYYRNSKNIDSRYTVTYSFSKSSGFTPVITFSATPNDTVKIKYQCTVEKFTGTGTEYSIFPANVVVAETMMNHSVEKGWESGEYERLKDNWMRVIRDFEQAYQYMNNEPRHEVTDNNGELVTFSGYDMDGNRESFQGRYDNDYDVGGLG